MALRAWYGRWFGLAIMLWYMVWPGGHAWCLVWPNGSRIVYSMARRASHCMAWQARHGDCIVYAMIWRAWHGIWYGLAGEEFCMVWTSGHSMIYGMDWRPWHGYAMAWQYMVCSCGHRMGYGMAWRGTSWYVERYSITRFKALSSAIVPFTRAVADVS